ncbi:MAG: hypothetical protein HGB12_00695 [Bacteroidetes bacterium]|nr:hypothetical protein [Bacteroidota bacterium]
MKTIFISFAVIFFMAANAVLAQKSIASFCNYKHLDTEVKDCGKADTTEIFFKGNSVGYIYCEKIKEKKQANTYLNIVFDHSMTKIAEVSNEIGQLVIKYTKPYKVIYVKGVQFNSVVGQMVEKDKRLKIKE